MGIPVNLWDLFPISLLDVNGILLLPYLVILLYGYVFYLTIKNVSERFSLLLFWLLSIAASTVMFINIKSPMGNITPPLFLLTLMAMPLTRLMSKLYRRDYFNARTWLKATLAAWLHSISWCVWFFIIAGS